MNEIVIWHYTKEHLIQLWERTYKTITCLHTSWLWHQGCVLYIVNTQNSTDSTDDLRLGTHFISNYMSYLNLNKTNFDNIPTVDQFVSYVAIAINIFLYEITILFIIFLNMEDSLKYFCTFYLLRELLYALSLLLWKLKVRIY